MDNYLLVCAKALEVMAIGYNTLTDRHDRQRMKRGMARALRSFSCHNGFKRGASVAAQKIAAPIDLRTMKWSQQSKFDPGRKLFIFEHQFTVNDMVASCIKNPEKCLEVLKSTRIVWITRAENRRLSALGYTTTRPDPDTAYREAEIELFQD